MPKKRAKCRHCGKGFLVEPGKFPKKLFDHIKKKHPNAVSKRRRLRSATSSEPRRRGSSRRSWKKVTELRAAGLSPREIAHQDVAGYEDGVWHPHGCRCEGCK